MMEMEQIGLPGAGASEYVDPGADEPLEGRIIDGSKDAVWRPRPVLVGGREGHRRRERIAQLEPGRVVERLDVEPGEEAARVRELPGRPERPGGEARLPASLRQRSRELPRDLRRSATGKEKQARNDPAGRRRATGAAGTPPPPATAARLLRTPPQPPNSARHRSPPTQTSLWGAMTPLRL